MKRIALTIACALASGIGGLALAQQPAPNMQPVPYQQTTPPTTPSDTQSSQQRSTESYSQQEHSTTTTSGTTSSDKRTLMKDCMAQQEQQKSSTGMSKHDMKKYCKNQVKSETGTQPH